MDVTLRCVSLALLKRKTFGSYLNLVFINCSEQFMEFFNQQNGLNDKETLIPVLTLMCENAILLYLHDSYETRHE